MKYEYRNPPVFLERLLKRLVLRRTGYGALGDYAEEYGEIAKEKSISVAVCWYTIHILVSFVRQISYKAYRSRIMFRNYFKVAIRNILKQKVYSLINISGLTIGMASCFLIYLYVQNELSYDRYHENADRIFRVVIGEAKSNESDYAGSPAPLADALLEKYPEIERAIRFDDFSFKAKTMLRYGDKSFNEDRFLLADPDIFRVFSFPLVKGDPDDVLVGPNKIVLTEAMAKKYFGEEDPIGKTMVYEGVRDFIVSGIMRDVPDNSHFKFDFLASFENLNSFYGGNNYMESWGAWNFYTYVMIREGIHLGSFQNKLRNYVKEQFDDDETILLLQKITDIHLRSNIRGEIEPNSDIRNVYIFSAVAAIILLIACINFMNLYTANSEARAREVGMRKVIGAYKKQLVSQFLGESMIITCMALPLSILIIELVLPQFNNITAKNIDINYFSDYKFMGAAFLLTLSVGVISGSYPAFFMSSFKPITMLKGRFRLKGRNISLRNILVVVQFIVSVIFIIGTLVVSSQMKYIKNMRLGYNRDNIVNVPIYSEETKGNYGVYRGEILNNPNVLGATATSFTPSVSSWHEGMFFEGKKDTDDHAFFRMSGDYNIIDLFEMEIVAGRNFDRNFPGDRNFAYILNEEAVKYIGWNNKEAVGKKFGNRENGKIIGVVRNFNFMSLHHEVEPLVISVTPRFFQYVSIRTSQENLSETLDFLENKWNEVNPGYPFEYYFYDEEFDKLYKSETRTEQLFSYFTFLAIFVACLGLLALASFTVEKRSKEIGIRKVLGANFAKVAMLLIREFLYIMIIANLVAIPAAYYFSSKWLQNFVFRTDLGLNVFISGSALTLVIAVLTISFQVMKGMYINPVDTLRNE
ncbi:ABC transporter permease [candidate division KSB1 bacterium]